MHRIARAIYKRSQVLVLDEATSALDQETESLIIENINKFDKDITILMIISYQHCEIVIKFSKYLTRVLS